MQDIQKDKNLLKKTKVWQLLKKTLNPRKKNSELEINNPLKPKNIIMEYSRESLIYQMNRISFELSNLCNYAPFHKKCPLHNVKEKIILPSKIVYKTINELAEIKYKGYINFHKYNEPLIDPRLFSFIQYAKTKCPESQVRLLTNGYYLNQTMVDELVELEVSMLDVSAYSKPEYERLKSLKVPVKYHVFYSELDDRGNQYEREPLDLQKSCFALVNDISVSCTGKVVLCCLDWQRMHTFGNLNNESLKKILKKSIIN